MRKMLNFLLDVAYGAARFLAGMYIARFIIMAHY